MQSSLACGRLSADRGDAVTRAALFRALHAADAGGAGGRPKRWVGGGGGHCILAFVVREIVADLEYV